MVRCGVVCCIVGCVVVGVGCLLSIASLSVRMLSNTLSTGLLPLLSSGGAKKFRNSSKSTPSPDAPAAVAAAAAPSGCSAALMCMSW